MSLDNVNLLGALIGAVVAMVIGAIWYAPPVFGNRWQAMIGKRPEEMGNPWASMVVAALMFLLLGIGLSWIIPDDGSIGVGLMWAFLAFWAFVLPATVINGVFEGRGWGLMLMYLAYMLVATLAVGAIITLLGG